MAQAVGEYLKRFHISHILTSTYPRAEETAAIINTFLNVPIFPTPLLEERKNPSEIIVAVPIVPQDAASMISGVVEKLVVLKVLPGLFGSIGNYYESFDQLSDEEVVELLSKSWNTIGIPFFFAVFAAVTQYPHSFLDPTTSIVPRAPRGAFFPNARVGPSVLESEARIGVLEYCLRCLSR